MRKTTIMKYLWILIPLLATQWDVFARQQDPVKWNYTVKQIGDKRVEVHLTASIEKGWYVYSQYQPGDAIAMPTKIVFAENPLLIFRDTAREVGSLEKKVLKELGVTHLQYEEKVDFVQTVILKTKARTIITGTISYQACTDQMCMPENTVSFSLPVPSP